MSAGGGGLGDGLGARAGRVPCCPLGGGRALVDLECLACCFCPREDLRPLESFSYKIEPEVRKGEAVLDQAERVAEELDYEVDAELLQAREVGPAVVDEAIERGVDLIVLGVPYKKRFGEFNLGKVAPYVLKNAPCRVWLVRQAISEIE